MSEQELNLFQLTARCVAEASARPAEVVRCNLTASQFGGVSFNDVPNRLFGDSLAPDFPRSTHAPKYLPGGYAAKRAPEIDLQLHPVRHGNGAPMTSADHVHDSPMVFAALYVDEF